MDDIIAVIMSDKMKRCHDFLYFHRLNPKKFICAIDAYQLCGLPKNLPIIVTHHGRLDENMYDMFDNYFVSVRYMDY